MAFKKKLVISQPTFKEYTNHKTKYSMNNEYIKVTQ